MFSTSKTCLSINLSITSPVLICRFSLSACNFSETTLLLSKGEPSLLNVLVNASSANKPTVYLLPNSSLSSLENALTTGSVWY